MSLFCPGNEYMSVHCLQEIKIVKISRIFTLALFEGKTRRKSATSSYHIGICYNTPEKISAGEIEEIRLGFFAPL